MSDLTLSRLKYGIRFAHVSHIKWKCTHHRNYYKYKFACAITFDVRWRCESRELLPRSRRFVLGVNELKASREDSGSTTSRQEPRRLEYSRFRKERRSSCPWNRYSALPYVLQIKERGYECDFFLSHAKIVLIGMMENECFSVINKINHCSIIRVVRA